MRVVFSVALAATLLSSVAMPVWASERYESPMFVGRPAYDGAVNVRRAIQPPDGPPILESVIERPRPDYDPIPVSVGSLEMFPGIEGSVRYDSNILATDTDEETDTIFMARPSLYAISNWSRHAVQLLAYSEVNRYLDNTDENYIDGILDAQGRIDVMTQTWIDLGLGYQSLTQQRSSLDDTRGGVEPTEYDVLKANMVAVRKAGLLAAEGGYYFRSYDFENVRRAAGGIINNNVRDRDEHEVGGRLGYDLGGGFIPFVDGRYNWRNYDSNTSRESDGYEVIAGTQLDFSGATSAVAYVGYQDQDYDNFRATQGNFIYGLTGLWNVTELTSIKAESSRKLMETGVAGYSSTLMTGGSVAVEHELQRNILLTASGDYTLVEFQNGAGREDDLIGAQLSGSYLFDRNFFADLGYDFTQRDSNFNASDFDRHIVMFKVGYRV